MQRREKPWLGPRLQRLDLIGERARGVAHLVHEHRDGVDEHDGHEPRDAEHHEDRAERPRHAHALEAIDERVERIREKEREKERNEDAAQQVREPDHERGREEDHLPAEAGARLLPGLGHRLEVYITPCSPC